MLKRSDLSRLNFIRLQSKSLFKTLISFKPNQTPVIVVMDAINPTILKTTIEAIPVLTEENFLTWKTRITALFKLGGLKDQILTGEPALEDVENSILCAVIIAKLSTTTHKNVVNSTNEEDTQLLWKNILKRFISNEPSNRTRVYNSFASITFDSSNIKKFITKDGEDINPKALIDHLEIHLNELKVSNGEKDESLESAMFTKEDLQCKDGAHNPYATSHRRENCWFVYPEKREEYLKKTYGSNTKPKKD
ncbi:hypothetical protein PGT21_017043 [Puccinia graminis f. sp. tritici]|uniref:DUF4219 domain-containing protein n=1 Tax=Puccinia graminis f. sp. tritici TaxID=56615 RepID=A0A5B0NB43_PUCGR|nr:hypothetical protein PGT21_017043 [Puccinia graminis f. sp. tritici]